MIPRLIICRMKRFRKPITLRTLLNLYSLSQKNSIPLNSSSASGKNCKTSGSGRAASVGLVSKPSSFGPCRHLVAAGRPSGSIQRLLPNFKHARGCSQPAPPLCTMHWCMGQLLLRPLYNLRFTKHHFPFHYSLQVLETLFQVENSLNEKAVIFCKKTFKNQFYF